MKPPFWIRRLINQLKRVEVVRSVKLYSERIRVVFTTKLSRNYLINDPSRIYRYQVIIKSSDSLATRIRIDYNDDGTFMVPRSTIDKSNLIQKEILIQELISYILITGIKSVTINHSDAKVYEDLVAIKNITKLKHDGKLWLYPSFYPRPGRVLIERYFDYLHANSWAGEMRSVTDAVRSKVILYRAISKLVNTSKADISSSIVLSSLYRLRYGPSWVCPAVYRAVVRLSGLNKPSIIDPFPNLGEKAIAASIDGLLYKPTTNCLDYANTRGFNDAIGVEYGTSPNSLTIAIKHFRSLDIETMDQFKGNGEVVTSVKHDQYKDALAVLKPHRIFKTHPYALRTKYEHDYLFFYH